MPAERKPAPRGRHLSSIRRTGTTVVCAWVRAITALLPMTMLVRGLRGHNCVLLLYVWKPKMRERKNQKKKFKIKNYSKK